MCANEGQAFVLPSTCDVAYGANGSFAVRSAQSGTITFNNATFGDPVPGVVKKGYYRLSGGQRFYVHANHLYSVAAITNSAGAVVERYRYSSYGERTVLTADGVTTRAVSLYNQQVGFTGRYLDKETGLWYFRARYYSGSLGRFVGRDPLGYVDGTSLYNGYFVPNALDPKGMDSVVYTLSFVADGGADWNDWYETARSLVDTIISPSKDLPPTLCASNRTCDKEKTQIVTETVTTRKYKVSYQRDQSKVDNVYSQKLTITSTSNSASTINTALSDPRVGAAFIVAAAAASPAVGVGITAVAAITSAISSDLSDSSNSVYPHDPILLTQRRTLNGKHETKYENIYTEEYYYSYGPCN